MKKYYKMPNEKGIEPILDFIRQKYEKEINEGKLTDFSFKVDVVIGKSIVAEFIIKEYITEEE